MTKLNAFYEAFMEYIFLVFCVNFKNFLMNIFFYFNLA